MLDEGVASIAVAEQPQIKAVEKPRPPLIDVSDRTLSYLTRSLTPEIRERQRDNLLIPFATETAVNNRQPYRYKIINSLFASEIPEREKERPAKPINGATLMYVEAAVRHGEQTLALGNTKTDKLDLVGIGIFEVLEDTFDLRTEVVDRFSWRDYFAGKKEIIEQYEVAAARALFTEWRSHPPTIKRRKLDVTTIPPDDASDQEVLQFFTTHYRNSDDFPTYAFGQYIGNKIAEMYKENAPREKPNEVMQRIADQNIAVQEIANNLQKQNGKFVSEFEIYVGIHSKDYPDHATVQPFQPLKKEEYSQKDFSQIQQETHFAAPKGHDKPLPDSHFTRLFATRCDPVTFGIMYTLRDRLGLTETNLAEFSEKRAEEAVEQFKNATDTLKLRSAKVLFQAWGKKSPYGILPTDLPPQNSSDEIIIQTFNKLVAQNPRFAGFYIGKTIAEQVKTLDKHWIFKKFHYDLWLDWELFFKNYSQDEVVRRVTADIKRKGLFVEAQPANDTAHAALESLKSEVARPRHDAFTFWIGDHWQEFFGKKTDLMVGLAYELRDELGFSEAYLPNKTYDPNYLETVRKNAEDFKPTLETIQEIIKKTGLQYSPDLPISEYEFGQEIGKIIREMHRDTFEHTRRRRDEAFEKIVRPKKQTSPHRADRALFAMSHLVASAVRQTQKLSNPEGTRIFKKRHSLKQNIGDVAVAIGVAKTHQMAADLFERSLERTPQMAGLAVAYLLRRLDINPLNILSYKDIPKKLRHDLNWKAIGKSAVRGISGAALTIAIDQGLRHIGVDSQLDVLQLPLAVTAAKLATSGVLNSLGVNIGNEWAINHIFHKKQTVDELGEYLHLRKKDPDAAKKYLYQKSRGSRRINKKMPEWRIVDDLLEDHLTSINGFEKAARVLRKAEDTLTLLIAHNPTAYSTRSTVLNNNDVTIDNLEYRKTIIELEAELHKKVRRIFPLSEAKRVTSILEEGQRFSEKATIQKEVLKHRATIALLGTAMNAVYIVGASIPAIRELGQELMDSLFGKATSLSPRPSMYQPNTNPVTETLFHFNPEHYDDFRKEITTRSETLQVLLDEYQHGTVTPDELLRYQIKIEDLQTVNLVLTENNLTTQDLNLLIKLSTAYKSNDPLSVMFQQQLENTPESSLVPLVKMIGNQGLNLKSSFVKSLNDQNLADELGAQNMDLLTKLNIKTGDFSYQIQFLNPQTRKAVLSSPKSFFIQEDLETHSKIVVMKGKDSLIADFTASPKDAARPLFILGQFEQVLSSNAADFQTAMNNPIYKYFLAESADCYNIFNDPSQLPGKSPNALGDIYSLALKSELFGPPETRQKTVNVLMSRAMQGDPAAFNSLYGKIKQEFPGEIYWFNKMFARNEKLNGSLIVNIINSQTDNSKDQSSLLSSVKKYGANLYLTPLTEEKKPDLSISGAQLIGNINAQQFNELMNLNTTPHEVMSHLLTGAPNPDHELEKLLGLPPLIFDEGRFSTYFHISRTSYPKTFFDLANQIEGPDHKNSKDFFYTLLRRGKNYFVDKNEAGGSDPAMQLVELIGGGPSNQPMLDPFGRQFLFRPDASEDPLVRFHTLSKTAAGAGVGEVPKEIQMLLQDPSTPETAKADLLSKMNWKFQSFILSQQLKSVYGEEGVRTMWLNYVPMGSVNGQAIYGIEAASRTYFGKSIDNLNLAEQLFLIGMINSPGANSPFRVPHAPLGPFANRDTVIDTGMIYAGQSVDQQAVRRVVAHIKNDTIPTILRGRNLLNATQIAQLEKDLDELHFSNEIPEQYQVKQPSLEGNKFLANFFVQGPSAEPIDHIPLAATKVDGVGIIIHDTVATENPTYHVQPLNFQRLPLPPVQNNESEALFATLLAQQPSPGATDYRVLVKPFVDDDQTSLEIKIPTFDTLRVDGSIQKVPGLALIALDEDKITGYFDQTGLFFNESSNSGVPIPIGSTIKPFLFSFLASQGVNTDELLPNQPGQWALNHVQLKVPMGNAYAQLNSTAPQNVLSLKQALAFSSNVPFEAALRKYIDDHPQDGWQNFQNYMRKFGLELVDQQGNELDKPTPAAAIGSDTFIKGGLYRLAHAYQMFADPENPSYGFSAENKSIIEAIHLTTQTLQDPSLKTTPSQIGFALDSFQVKMETIPDGFVKTGTVGGASYGTTHLLTVVVTPNGAGGKKVLVGFSMGQALDPVTKKVLPPVDLGEKAFGSTTVLPLLWDYYKNVSQKQ